MTPNYVVLSAIVLDCDLTFLLQTLSSLYRLLNNPRCKFNILVSYQLLHKIVQVCQNKTNNLNTTTIVYIECPVALNDGPGVGNARFAIILIPLIWLEDRMIRSRYHLNRISNIKKHRANLIFRHVININRAIHGKPTILRLNRRRTHANLVRIPGIKSGRNTMFTFFQLLPLFRSLEGMIVIELAHLAREVWP